MKVLLEKIFQKIKKTPGDIVGYEDLYYMCLEALNEDKELAVEYLQMLSKCIEDIIPGVVEVEFLQKLFDLHKKVLLAAAPYHFESYILYIEWNREPDKKFYPPRRTVLSQVVDALQELADDKLDLLAVSLSPGAGKSTLAIFFLTWW
nr:MAG TPA: Bacterial TniB protein [Siphoviridae sp. ctuK76]